MKINNITRAAVGVLKGKITGKPSPMFMILAITNRCDSNCAYCRIPWRQLYEMSTAEIFQLLEQAVSLGVQRIGIWGGEPLVRQDIGDVIHKAKQLGLYVTLDTNGCQLIDRLPDIKGLDHLIISLDGNEDAHNANRTPGSFNKVMAAITLAAPIIKTWTITVLTKNNINQIDWIIDQAKRLGFVATFQVLHHNPKMGDSISLLPDPEEYRFAIDLIIRRKKEGAPIGTSFACLEHLKKWQNYEKIYQQQGNLPCWAGKFFFNVDTDGSIYPCSLLVEEQKAPNFLEVGLAKALEQMPVPSCNTCLATCYTEYKMLFNMHFPTIAEWINAMIFRGGK